MSHIKVTMCWFVLGMVVSNVSVAQETPDPRKWSHDPRMSRLQPTGELPVASSANVPAATIDAKPRVVYTLRQSPVTASPYTSDYVGFAKSTNGGATWSGLVNAYDCNGARNSSLSPWGIRINDFPSMAVDRSGGARNGWIYIVTNEKSLASAGSDEDIVMHRSPDGGTTWSAGIRVNQDALNNGKKQYMPWMCVDDAAE